MNNAPFEIAGRRIGPGAPCFVIAEAGVNHNGDPALARRLVDAAAAAGADAVKFQTFKSEQVVSPAAPKADYQVQTTGSAESQLEMVKRLELTFDAFRELSAYCQHSGILFLSTPFDPPSVDLLQELNVPAFKLASGEITNLSFLAYVARQDKPLILSTGMAFLGEVETAVRTVREAGNRHLALLHCVSNYPAEPSDANLRAMHTLAAAFNVPVGYSDHTLGSAVALASVALGACILEKHFTLDRGLPGPDHRASLEPGELAALVRDVRTVEAALGHGRKEPAPSETNSRKVGRRSLVAACDIPAGTVLTAEHITCRRPGTGLAPALSSVLLGRVTRQLIPAGALLNLDMLH